MAASIINGKEIAERIKEEIRNEALAFAEKHGRKPGLAVILVGDDPASAIYVRNKSLACEKCEIRSLEYRLPASASQEEVELTVKEVAANDLVDGMLVQLPLPKHINEKKNRLFPPKKTRTDSARKTPEICCSAENVFPLALRKE